MSQEASLRRLVVPALMLTLVIAAAPSPAAAKVTVAALRTDNATRPLGTDNATPRFTWQLRATRRGVLQRAYRLRIARSPAAARAGRDLVWDSGRRRTSEPRVDYAGPALESGTRYYWTARVWDEKRRATRWARPTWFETAYLDPAQLGGEWITRPLAEGDTACGQAGAPREEADCAPPPPILRTEFTATKRVRRARLYASGLGYGVYRVNGRRLGDVELTPAFTDYRKRVLYTTFDATKAVRRGANALGVELGRGYYSMTGTDIVSTRFSVAGWHDEPKVRLALVITYKDGTSEQVVSDPSKWRATTGPTIYDHLLNGETYDGARARELGAWTEPGYDDAKWVPAAAAKAPKGPLEAEDFEPSRIVERRRFKSVTEPQPGVYVFDLEDAVSGWTEIRVKGKAGDAVTVVHNDKLNEDGTVPEPYNVTPDALASQKNVYRLAGTGTTETYRPQFTYHGFRYVQVTGWPGGGKPTLDDVTVEVVRSDLRDVGAISASDPLLAQIVGNMRAAILQNMQGIHTDTPIFEKTGWMEVLHNLFPSTQWLLDIHRLYDKITTDVTDGQFADGTMPMWVPNDAPAVRVVAWNGAVVLLPPHLYRYYGEDRGLAARYEAAQRYVKTLVPDPNGLLGPLTNVTPGGDWGKVGNGYGYGDVPATAFNFVGTGRWPDANAWWYSMIGALADMADVLGKPDEAKAYRRQLEDIKAAYNATFYNEALGRYDDPSDPQVYSQHVNAISLEIGLVPDDRREKVAANLNADVVSRDYHLTTGEIGTRPLFRALGRNGYADTAARTALQTTYPSYGYWIKELGWKSLGEFWEATSRSRSHDMQGTVVEWFFEGLAGMQVLKPGFAEILFAPEVPAHGLDWVQARHDSPRGEVKSAWRKTAGKLEIKVTVPPNARGIVRVPAAQASEVAAPGRAVPQSETTPGRVSYAVGSGTWTFTTAAPK